MFISSDQSANQSQAASHTNRPKILVLGERKHSERTLIFDEDDEDDLPIVDKSLVNVEPDQPTTMAKSLSRLIANEEWDAACRVIIENNDAAAKTKKKKFFSRFDDGRVHCNIATNALLFACRFRPPSRVIQLLFEVYDGSAQDIDSMGRTVLHVALQYGCNPEVIGLLCGLHPESTGVQDVLGRTPLHYFCKYYVDLVGKTYHMLALCEILKFILKESPAQTINVEDSACGFTALEYAIEAELSVEMCNLLQKAAQKQWAAARKEASSHEKLMKDLHQRTDDSKRNLQFQLRKLRRPLHRVNKEQDLVVDPEAPTSTVGLIKKMLARSFVPMDTTSI